MTEWKTYRLGDVCSRLRSGKGIPASEVSACGKFAVVGGNGVRGYTDKSNFNGQCVVVGRQGAYCGNVRYFDGEFYMTEHAVVIVGNEYADTHFLAYLLSIMELGHLSAQSAQPGLSVQTLSKLEISLPSLEEQRRIAGILGAIDDKIENNRRINTNLELQAQALYKQWFVDFEFPNEEGKPYKSSGGKMVDSDLGPIPDGWSVGTLSDLANVTMGQSPNGKSFNENGDGIVFYQGRTEFGVRYPSIRLYTTEPTRYAEPMSVLLSVRAPVGDINIATQRCCIGRGVASIKSKTDDNAYMYCCLKELRPQLDQYNGEGTVFGSINRKELEGLSLCVPKEEVITLFNNSILGMDKQMLNLFQQTQNLTNLRDTLLPKLMNGEIKL